MEGALAAGLLAAGFDDATGAGVAGTCRLSAAVPFLPALLAALDTEPARLLGAFFRTPGPARRPSALAPSRRERDADLELAAAGRVSESVAPLAVVAESDSR